MTITCQYFIQVFWLVLFNRPKLLHDSVIINQRGCFKMEWTSFCENGCNTWKYHYQIAAVLYTCTQYCICFLWLTQSLDLGGTLNGDLAIGDTQHWLAVVPGGLNLNQSSDHKASIVTAKHSSSLQNIEEERFIISLTNLSIKECWLYSSSITLHKESTLAQVAEQ